MPLLKPNRALGLVLVAQGLVLFLLALTLGWSPQGYLPAGIALIDGVLATYVGNRIDNRHLHDLVQMTDPS
jgi:hypothetical protein